MSTVSNSTTTCDGPGCGRVKPDEGDHGFRSVSHPWADRKEPSSQVVDLCGDCWAKARNGLREPAEAALLIDSYEKQIDDLARQLVDAKKASAGEADVAKTATARVAYAEKELASQVAENRALRQHATELRTMVADLIRLLGKKRRLKNANVLRVMVQMAQLASGERAVEELIR